MLLIRVRSGLRDKGQELCLENRKPRAKQRGAFVRVTRNAGGFP